MYIYMYMHVYMYIYTSNLKNATMGVCVYTCIDTHIFSIPRAERLKGPIPSRPCPRRRPPSRQLGRSRPIQSACVYVHVCTYVYLGHIKRKKGRCGICVHVGLCVYDPWCVCVCERMCICVRMYRFRFSLSRHRIREDAAFACT